MTKKQRALHKLGNAVRALQGRIVFAPGQTQRPEYSDTAPRRDAVAQARVKRWFRRCRAAGYV